MNTPNNVDLYFAYGSNLDESQMERRCPDAVFSAKAHLRDHRLAFTGRSSTRGCAVATVLPAAGQRTEGVLWRVSKSDLRSLDGCEGHPHVYYREVMTLTLDDGQEVQAWVYIKRDEMPGTPSQEYYGIIRRGYEKWGLDVSLLEAATSANQ